jgi:hypothetical protein
MTANDNAVSPEALPDVRRIDVGLVVVDTVAVPDRARQRQTADALLAADRPWDAGLLTDSVLLSTDGLGVLRYSQWSDDAAVADAHRRSSAAVSTTGDATRSVRHRLYRSAVPDDAPTPGVVVVVTFDTDDADVGRRLVDALLDRHPVVRGTAVPAGMGGNHFHLADDGTQLLNWAEFADEDAHQRVVDTALRPDDDVPRLLAETPGLRPRGFRRYLPYGLVSRGSTTR